MPETWHPFVYLIVWRFHSFLTSFLTFKKINIHKPNAFHVNKLTGTNMLSWTSCLKQSITQAEKEPLKCDHEFSMHWFACHGPNLWDKLLVVKKQCSIVISPFSDQFSLSPYGQKPCSFVALKYKAAGTIGLLFDLSIFNH